jgi:hypothetical protein
MPPSTEAPMQDEPITECGSRPSGASVCSSRSSVAPGRHSTWRPSFNSWMPVRRSVLTSTIGRP